MCIGGVETDCDPKHSVATQIKLAYQANFRDISAHTVVQYHAATGNWRQNRISDVDPTVDHF